MAIIPIKSNHNDSIIGKVDESVSLTAMKQNCPSFFKTKFGKRESYIEHRGCIIVRNTVQFTGELPKRRTACYLYFPNGYEDNGKADFQNIMEVKASSTVRQAKKIIDRLLDKALQEAQAVTA